MSELKEIERKTRLRRWPWEKYEGKRSKTSGFTIYRAISGRGVTLILQIIPIFIAPLRSWGMWGCRKINRKTLWTGLYAFLSCVTTDLFRRKFFLGSSFKKGRGGCTEYLGIIERITLFACTFAPGSSPILFLTVECGMQKSNYAMEVGHGVSKKLFPGHQGSQQEFPSIKKIMNFYNNEYKP